MAFDDIFKLLSVREGTPQGKSIENRMIDAMGGPETIRKKFQNNPDGSVVMAHTRGPGTQPEFITLTLEQTFICEVGMESGVIDLTSAGFIPDANSNDPGTLLYTALVDAYVTASGTALPDVPVIDVIQPPATKGVAPGNSTTSKAFPADMYDKKRVAVLCPPSVFTGKTRLYVQAMYGRHEIATTISLAPTVGALTPSIVLSNGIEITTSCGVYLDTATGLHYLLKVDATKVYIYDLVSTSCAEKLRPKLLDIGISADNRERIEAYILSRALPIPSSVVELVYAPGTPFDINQMGYGWHWNWSGTMCDIVVTTNDGTSNHSTHYRITMSHTPHPAMVWTQTPTTVEGPTTWKNNKHNSVICYPVWDYSGFQKIGTVATPTGNSPYYAFYNRDVLKVARFSAGSTNNNKFRSRSPSYYNEGLGVTMGSDALEVRQHEAWTGASVTITCGGTSISYQSGSYSETLTSRSSPQIVPLVVSDPSQFNKEPFPRFAPAAVKTGRPPIAPLTTYGDAYEGSITVYTGGTGPDSGGTGTYPTVVVDFPPDGSRTSFPEAFGADSTWTARAGTSNYLHTANYISAPPFYDAEAMCTFGGRTIYFSETGTETQKIGGWYYRRIWSGLNSSGLPDTLESTYETFWDGTGGTISSAGYSIPQYAQSASAITKLECNAGTLTAIIPNGNPFFNAAYSIVPVFLGSYASAQGSSVFSDDLTVDQGNAPAVLTGIPFTYSGWA